MSLNELQGLLSRACAGDRAALHDLLVDSLPKLHLLVRRVFNRRIRHLCDPEDCVQTAVVSLLRHRWRENSITSVEAMLAYFTRAVMNSMRDAKRCFLFAHKRDPSREDHRPIDVPQRCLSVETIVEGQDWFEHYLLSVSPEMRQVVVLMWEDNSAAEVSRLLGIAYWKIHRFLVSERRRQQFRSTTAGGSVTGMNGN